MGARWSLFGSDHLLPPDDGETLNQWDVANPYALGTWDILLSLLSEKYSRQFLVRTARGGRKLHTLTLGTDMGTVEMELLLL